MTLASHINSTTIEKVAERLSLISHSLKGLGVLFNQAQICSSSEKEDIDGVGSTLELLSEQVSILEDILNCGYDSMAIKRYGSIKNNNQ